MRTSIRVLVVCVAVLALLAGAPNSGEAAPCMKVSSISSPPGGDIVNVQLAIPKATDDAARIGDEDFGVRVVVTYDSPSSSETVDSGRVAIKDTIFVAQTDAITALISLSIPTGSLPAPSGFPNYNGTAQLLSPAGAVLCVVDFPAGTTRGAYVANAKSNSVSVIDLTTNAVVATVPVGTTPIRVAAAPSGGRVYVTNTRANSVSVIDTVGDPRRLSVNENTVVATVAVGATPTDLALTPDGGRVYVINSGANTVSVIDTATNTVMATVVVGRDPSSIFMTDDGSRAYVTNGGSNSVSVIDLATNTVVATIAVGRLPVGATITP